MGYKFKVGDKVIFKEGNTSVLNVNEIYMISAVLPSKDTMKSDKDIIYLADPNLGYYSNRFDLVNDWTEFELTMRGIKCE